MKVQMFVLCDAATEHFGKMFLIGTFDRIHSAKTPAVHPACAVAAMVRFDRIEEGQHKIKCTFCDEDGKLLIPPLERNVSVMFPQDASSITHNMVLNIHGLKLEKYGEYSIDLAIDGRHEASIPLFVCPVPNAQPKR